MATLTQIDPDVDDGIEYPSSDGKPMAETEIHLLIMVEVFQMLRNHYASRDDAYVIANMLWYWKRGDPSASASPDVMVVFGVDKRIRTSFRSWKEGGAIPSVNIEMASKSTWKERLTQDKKTYECQGVKEYFIFDPNSRFLPEQLMGFRMKNRRYVKIKPGRGGGLLSKELNLRLIPEGVHLRPVDVATGKMLQTDAEVAAEAAEKARKEAERANQEAERANQEAERANQEAERANQEAEKAGKAKKQVEEERKRANLLQAELDKLRAQFRKHGPKTNGAGPSGK